MQRTYYHRQGSGFLGNTDLVRSRSGSRSVRPVLPPEPVIRIDVGDPVEAVDAGWRSWSANAARVA
jgi:hypothetical protein